MSEREILDQLITAGKITEEDISELMTPAKKELAENVHLMMCSEDHDSGECQWYVEEQLDNTWKRSAHVKGTGRVNDILRRFNLTLGEAIGNLNSVRTTLRHAEVGGYTELLRFVLSSNPTKLIPKSTTKNTTGSSDDSSLPS